MFLGFTPDEQKGMEYFHPGNERIKYPLRGLYEWI